MQIIIAWTEEDSVVVRERRTDLGERPVFKTVTVAKTALWLNDGTAEDVRKAEDFLKSDRPEGRVYTFPAAVKDARAAAAKLVLEGK